MVNRALFEAFKFKYVTKAENGGVHGYKCLICDKKFPYKMTKITAKRHFMMCESIHKHRKELNKSQTVYRTIEDMPKAAFDETKFRAKNYVSKSGDVQTIVECIRCQVSYFNVEHCLKIHKYVSMLKIHLTLP